MRRVINGDIDAHFRIPAQKSGQVFSHGQNRLRASREIISCTILTTFQLAASTYVRNKGPIAIFATAIPI
jgi:hypothetical protein